MPSARLLIIDDDQHVFARVRMLLAGIVEDVEWAGMPELGLRLALQNRPDVILLDINMPKMDGLKVCRHLKETEATRDIPILFLTVERNMSSLARALECGGSDYILKPFNEVDLRARMRVALRTKGMIDLLKEQARIDALTGLSNRAALDSALEAAIASRQRLATPFALLMIDVDHFKEINDGQGHGVGDDVLRRVASALRRSCRPYDTACRFGGDEFGIVLGQTEGDGARNAAKRILAAVYDSTLPHAGGEIQVSCSAGLALSETLPADFAGNDIVKAADAALYDAKRQGRRRLCVHEGESA